MLADFEMFEKYICFWYNRIILKTNLFGVKMNKCEKINITEWNRAELFQEFIGMRTSIYDMSVRMNVTKLVKYCKQNGQSFFINFLYLTLRELNNIPEFRMRIHNGEPYIYDKVDCSFTVANNYDYFVNRSAEFTDYQTFYQAVDKIIAKAKTEKIHTLKTQIWKERIYFTFPVSRGLIISQ